MSAPTARHTEQVDALPVLTRSIDGAPLEVLLGIVLVLRLAA
jgi:hypothetical protein